MNNTILPKCIGATSQIFPAKSAYLLTRIYSSTMPLMTQTMRKPVQIFLRLVETNKINGVITPHILDEVLFKILVAEASQHIEKFNMPNLKKELKNASFSSRFTSR